MDSTHIYQNKQVEETVIVSTGQSKLHMFYAARAAQNAGLLRSLITPIYTKAKWVPTIERLKNITKKKLFKQLLSFHDNTIDERKVVTFPSAELLSRLRMFINRRGTEEEFRFRLERTASLYYGKRANRHVTPGTKLIHSRSGYSRAIIPHAHKIGAKVLLEQSAAHPEFVAKIMDEEYEKWNIPARNRTYLSPKKEMEWDLENADFVLTNSDFCADTIRPYVTHPENIRIVYTGVDVKAFTPGNEKKNSEFTLLCVGTVTIGKGIIYLIRAFKKLGLSKARLVVIGKRHTDLPTEFDDFRGLYHYLPFVPHNELPTLMSRADVFVLPSLAEGSARVIGEAMACGLACIVTPNCGSTISDGEDGFIVPPKNEDVLAEKILYLYQNRDICFEMGRKGREKVVSSLTWEHYQKNLIDVYKQILSLS